MDGNDLTGKQRVFAEAFHELRDAAAAYMAISGARNLVYAQRAGKRLLTKPEIQEYLAALEKPMQLNTDAERLAAIRDANLAVVQDPSVSAQARAAAAREARNAMRDFGTLGNAAAGADTRPELRAFLDELLAEVDTTP